MALRVKVVEHSLGDEKCPHCNAYLDITDDRLPVDLSAVRDERHHCDACDGVILVSLWHSVDIRVDLAEEDWPEWRKVKYDDAIPTFS